MRPRQPDVPGHCSWQLCPKRPSLQARKRECGCRGLCWAPGFKTYLACSPSKVHAHGLRVFPQPGILSCPGPSAPLLLTLLTAGPSESRGAHTLAVLVMADTSMQAARAFLGTVLSPVPSLTTCRNVLSAADPHPLDHCC